MGRSLKKISFILLTMTSLAKGVMYCEYCFLLLFSKNQAAELLTSGLIPADTHHINCFINCLCGQYHVPADYDETGRAFQKPKPEKSFF